MLPAGTERVASPPMFRSSGPKTQRVQCGAAAAALTASFERPGTAITAIMRGRTNRPTRVARRCPGTPLRDFGLMDDAFGVTLHPPLSVASARSPAPGGFSWFDWRRSIDRKARTRQSFTTDRYRLPALRPGSGARALKPPEGGPLHAGAAAAGRLPGRASGSVTWGKTLADPPPLYQRTRVRKVVGQLSMAPRIDGPRGAWGPVSELDGVPFATPRPATHADRRGESGLRSEEHTSELQSP